MNSMGVFIAAHILLSSVFVGYGLEGLLRSFGVLPDGAPSSVGTLALNVGLVVAGLLIVVGWQVRWVALALVAFLLVDAFISHQFWRYTGADQHGQLLHFLKNFSMLGGISVAGVGGECRAVK